MLAAVTLCVLLLVSVSASAHTWRPGDIVMISYFCNEKLDTITFHTLLGQGDSRAAVGMFKDPATSCYVATRPTPAVLIEPVTEDAGMFGDLVGRVWKIGFSAVMFSYTSMRHDTGPNKGESILQ